MCGITGILGMHGQRIDAARAMKMAKSLYHRGPDAYGHWAGDSASFGFTRLSFLDLEGGNQPMFNEDNTIVSVCNGEIYNYRELRSHLQARGHIFNSNTDVEVIGHLFEEYGEEMVHHLEGQFAFAVFDTTTGEAFFARDSFGVCPFYYTEVEGELLFASEVKALLVDDRVDRSVDMTALDQVLTFPGLLSPRSMVAGVHSLPAGHSMWLRNGKLHVEQYWDMEFPERGEHDLSDIEEATDLLQAALEEAVEMRLHADVPIGFYLSGGLDSSIVAMMIKRLGGSERHSFSIGFDDPDYDESVYQQELAKSLHCQVHRKTVRTEDVDELLRRAVLHSECPLKESYNTASLALSGLAKANGVPGVLSGEGADELFAGYVGHRFDKMRAERSGGVIDDGAEEASARLRMWGDESVFYERKYAEHSGMRRSMYSPAMAAGFEEFDCTTSAIVDPTKLAGRHYMDQRSYLDFHLRLTDHLVSDHGDRMVMANSVEGRYPFLQRSVAEIATRLDPELRLNGFTEKFVVRKVAERIGVPASVLNREKFHFVAPSSASLLQSGSELVEHLLAPSTIRHQGFFDPTRVQQLADRYRTDGFRLNLPYEEDLLMPVLTLGCLVEELDLATCGR